MFKNFITLSIIACQLLLFSCDNRRNPNLSKQQLQALLTDGNVISESLNRQFTMPEGYVPQAGIKYQQVRDLSVPPVRIDIVKGIDHVRNFTLSQIAKDITYINVGKHRFKVQAQITPHGILVNNSDGVWLYAPDGQLIREIYRNICEYQPMTGGGMLLKTGDKFSGIGQIKYDEKDDRLWVKFNEEELGENYRGFLGFIDMSSQLNDVSNSEIKQNPIVPLAGFGRGSMNYTDNFVTHRSYGRNSVFTTNSFYGDTLCRIVVGYDSITARAMAKAPFFLDTGHSYMYRGQYTFRYPFSDTLFRITDVNKLKPEYLIDMGKSGRATNQGKIEDVRIEQMYILQILLEDDRYFYISFTKDRDFPINRNNQKVHFWWGIYDKTNREFFTLPLVSDRNPEEKGIENDIDGGLPFWPHGVGNQGEKYMYVTGENMKNRLPKETPEKLKQFMQTVEDDDQIIVIVK